MTNDEAQAWLRERGWDCGIQNRDGVEWVNGRRTWYAQWPAPRGTSFYHSSDDPQFRDGYVELVRFAREHNLQGGSPV